MARYVKTKSSFGTARIDHFSPQIKPGDPTPKVLNVVLSFEEALKLHLGLLQALGKLNSYNRQGKDGRLTGIDIGIFTETSRITITEEKIRDEKGEGKPTSPKLRKPRSTPKRADGTEPKLEV